MRIRILKPSRVILKPSQIISNPRQVILKPNQVKYLKTESGYQILKTESGYISGVCVWLSLVRSYVRRMEFEGTCEKAEAILIVTYDTNHPQINQATKDVTQNMLLRACFCAYSH